MKKITPNDPDSKSADIVEDNVAQLQTLFPEAFSEGKIDFDVLKQLLGGTVEEREEKYGLTWHGKRRARQLALTPSTGTLRPCPEESVDWNTTQNLMIEGDNLEVLKLLQKSYVGKVKLIYIDPPYNKGKDFVYPDDFQDNIRNYLERTGQVEGDGRKNSSNTESSGRFHTDWLNMISPRLRLARNLMKEDGIILISIDDSEASNLGHLCNEIFGEENFIACLTWEKGRKNDAKFFSSGHEYLFVFAKSQALLREQKTIWREEKPGAREIWDKYLELRAKHGESNELIERDLSDWFSSLPKGDPSKKWSRYKRIDANGPWRDRDISWPGEGGPNYPVPHNKTGQPCKVPDTGWRFSTWEEMQRQIRLGLVEFREDHTQPPFCKTHLRPISEELQDEAVEDTEAEDDTDEDEELATQVRGTYFYKQSQVTVKYLKKLLGAKVFNNPKDHVELGKLFAYVTSNDPNAIILDFFAGSGTTAHSVMELNKSDSGKRRYILVQLPEPLDAQKKEQKVAAKFCDQLGKPRNIAELTKERLRRAAEMLEDEKSLFDDEIDLGFRVFKLDSSNIREWDPIRGDLSQSLFDSVEHLKADRSEEDILFELLLKLGLDLAVPIEQKAITGKSVHSIGFGSLFVCLTLKIGRDDVEPLALGIVAWHRGLAPAGKTQIVFRDSAFADDVAKTNMTAILQQHGLENVRSL